ncbi:MAG TPA: hypothetical protein VNJ09_04105 [Chthonomonadales bacterium]|nr:hypothetical protein [Chthonomonadales bacterium]
MSARAPVWQGYAIVGGPRGFAAVHLETGKANHFCNMPPRVRFAFTIAEGAAYFHSGAHWMAAQIKLIPQLSPAREKETRINEDLA